MKEIYSIHITSNAKKDLAEIYDYISSDNQERAVSFTKEIEEKILSLEKFPERNPLIRENSYFGTEYRHILHKNYRIIFRIFQNDLFVLRIFHGSKLLNL